MCHRARTSSSVVAFLRSCVPARAGPTDRKSLPRSYVRVLFSFFPLPTHPFHGRVRRLLHFDAIEVKLLPTYVRARAQTHTRAHARARVIRFFSFFTSSSIGSRYTRDKYVRHRPKTARFRVYLFQNIRDRYNISYNFLFYFPFESTPEPRYRYAGF